MKRFFCLIASLIIVATCALSCAKADKTKEGAKVVCTIFPQYDWVKNIAKGSGMDIELLTDNGVDLHNFQPTARDIVEIASSDLFIYVGGTSDSWAQGVLDTTAKGVKALSLMSLVDAKIEEETEGMEHEEEHDHSHDEYDEHVWLSLNNARTICEQICGYLCEIDEDNSQLFIDNKEAYIAKLEALDGEFREAANKKGKDTLVFADRFAFRYLLDDYGFHYYAAFPGCSTDTEASFETIRFLAAKLDETDLKYVLMEKGDTESIAKTVIENTKNRDQKILKLDSLQSITKEDISKGASYIEAMKQNLAVIEQALS